MEPLSKIYQNQNKWRATNERKNTSDFPYDGCMARRKFWWFLSFGHLSTGWIITHHQTSRHHNVATCFFFSSIYCCHTLDSVWWTRSCISWYGDCLTHWNVFSPPIWCRLLSINHTSRSSISTYRMLCLGPSFFQKEIQGARQIACGTRWNLQTYLSGTEWSRDINFMSTRWSNWPNFYPGYWGVQFSLTNLSMYHGNPASINVHSALLGPYPSFLPSVCFGFERPSIQCSWPVSTRFAYPKPQPLGHGIFTGPWRSPKGGSGCGLAKPIHIIPWFCDLVLGKLNIPFTHPGKNMEEPETKGTFLQTL